MNEVLQFGILGLASGGLIALFAMGLVAVYRGSGVVNFAAGAIGMVGTYVYWDLAINAGWPFVPAALCGVATSALLSLLTHVVIMRPLRSAAPVARIIATLGVMTVLTEAASHHYPTELQIVPSALPTSTVEVLGATVGVDKLILLGICLAVVCLLGAIYRYTQFGRATTAATENRRALAALGHSADRIAAINWIIGGVLTGSAGILLAPITGIKVTTLTLLVLPALAAAVVGNLRSLSLTLLGALFIGVTQAEMSRYVSAPGWADSVPFVLIIVILILRGPDRGLRAQVAERLPKLGSGRVRPGLVIPIAVTAILILQLGIPATWLDSIIMTASVAVILLSFVVVTGYSGQLSLAQYAFAGWGAWVAGRLVAETGMPFVWAALIGVLATLPLGLLMGVVCLRTRGVNLAIATLGLAVTLEHLVFTNAKYTGGITGTVVGFPTLFGIDVNAVIYPARYATMAITVFIVVALVVANLRRSGTGRHLIATRANERAASSLGVNTMAAKVFSFGVASGIAALGGILLAFRSPSINYSMFGTINSINLVAQSVVGGVGWIAGPIVGALGQVGGVISQLLNPLGTNVASYVPLIGGVLLLVTIITAPDGASALFWRQLQTPIGMIHRLRASRSVAESQPAELEARVQAPEPVQVRPLKLEIEDLEVRFGGVRALKGVSLEVNPGEVVGLIGPNGAGKTTLVDAVTGMVRASGGTVRLGGQDITGMPANRVAIAGLTRSFQSLELFDDMTVLDNLFTASEPVSPAGYALDLLYPRQATLTPVVEAAIAEFELADCLHELPSDLPYGRRRLVAIARAVATMPSVLCLDEPAAGLGDVERDELAHLIRRLSRDWNMGILLIEHDTELVMRTCDRICALNFGEQLAYGTPTEVRNDPAVISSYLGAAQPAGAGETS